MLVPSYSHLLPSSQASLAQGLNLLLSPPPPLSPAPLTRTPSSHSTNPNNTTAGSTGNSSAISRAAAPPPKAFNRPAVRGSARSSVRIVVPRRVSGSRSGKSFSSSSSSSSSGSNIGASEGGVGIIGGGGGGGGGKGSGEFDWRTAALVACLQTVQHQLSPNHHGQMVQVCGMWVC